MDYAVIDNTGLVVNVVQWDGSTPWEPPAGHIALPLLDGGIGWTFADGQFVPPPPKPEPEGDPEPDPGLN
jgi:hypothetical protein